MPQVQYLPLQLPENRVELDDAIETMKKAVYNADRVTITYDDVTSGLTHQPDRWFRYSDEKGISVPFALSGANKVLSLELASDALSPKYHTLVTGMIGSGKSTLLHTLIMGLLMKYSPEDVQIYLMDFKDGVEFKIYTEYDLKNFRAISIDTEPEFGLAVLKKIEAERHAIISSNRKAAAVWKATAVKWPKKATHITGCRAPSSSSTSSRRPLAGAMIPS